MSSTQVMPLGSAGMGLDNTCKTTARTCSPGLVGCHASSDFSGAGCSAYYLSNP